METSSGSKNLKAYDSGRPTKKTPSEYIKSRFSSKRMSKIDKIEKELADRLVRSIGPDGSLLDIPCGSGRFLSSFSGLHRIVAADINLGMLEEAKATNPFANIEFLLGGAQDIPLENNSVDAVFCMRLLHHIESKDEIKNILNELARVSRKMVLISFYRAGGLKYWLKKIRGKKITGKPIRCEDMLKLCEEAGLISLELHKLPSTKQTIVLLAKQPMSVISFNSKK